ncbi:MAG: chemotaxis protein CheD [Pseudomonadota bacterium]
MNHILLPGRPDKKGFDGSTRYGINAMELLINRLMNLGGNRNKLVAKIFGGANMLSGISENNSPGLKNAKFVREFLKVERIRVISQDIGGYDSRSIFFHTDSGDVLLKRVRSRYYKKVTIEEQKYLERIQKEIKKPTDITLF